MSSNRDENISRERAEKPAFHRFNGTPLWYPQDPQSKGSWIMVNEQKELGILLNGAQEKHSPKDYYKQSRGYVLLSIMSHIKGAFQGFNDVDLHHIEPFTLILYCNTELFSLIWDGEKKKRVLLDKHQGNIWVSSTLYNQADLKMLKERFNSLTSFNNIGKEHIFDFHYRHQYQNIKAEYSTIHTLSISQVFFPLMGQHEFFYHELKQTGQLKPLIKQN